MVHVRLISRTVRPQHRKQTLAAPSLLMRIVASSLMLNAVIATDVASLIREKAIHNQRFLRECTPARTRRS